MGAIAATETPSAQAASGEATAESRAPGVTNQDAPAVAIEPDVPQSRQEAATAGGGDEYANIARGLALLESRAGGAVLRLSMMRELLRLGLGGPARELAARAENSFRERPEVVALLALPFGASGKRSWSTRAARFAGNVAALRERDPAAATAIERSWSAGREQYELYTDARGVDQVRVATQAGWRWWPRLADHAALAARESLPGDIEQNMPGPYVFGGIELGWYFARLHARTADTFLGYASALLVYEPDPARLAVAFHLHDWSALLRDDRVLFFPGEGGLEALRSRLMADVDLPYPRVRFLTACLPAEGAQALDAALLNVQEARIELYERGLEEISRSYESRDAGYWAARYDAALRGAGPPLRILSSVSTHTSFLQYSMRDAANALRALGHEVRVISEQRCFDRISAATYHRLVREFDPDLFFVIDHLRGSFRNLLPMNLPLMTWDQDALPTQFNEANVRTMGPLDLVVGLPHVDCVARWNCDPARFLVAAMPTAHETYDDTPIDPHELRPYECDVSYVSHASGPVDELCAELLREFPDAAVRALAQRAAQIALREFGQAGVVRGGLLRAWIQRAERETGLRILHRDLREHLANWFLWRICDRHFRHEALEWAAAWARQTGRTLRIWGRGWDRHPTLAPFAAGEARNGAELLRIYRASQINLQLIGVGLLHQRALDGLMGGAFFLTRASDADVRDPRILPLVSEIRRRGYRSAAALRESGEQEMIAAFETLRETFGFDAEEGESAFHTLLCDALRDYPAEVLPDFDQIVFRDAAGFARAAGRYLADPEARRQQAAAFRRVVSGRYSYRATMDRFIRFAGEFFAKQGEARP